MKAGIHPQYTSDVTVVCSCGATFVTGSTKGAIRVDLCSNCHPFYTGTQKLIDTEGKVDKFDRKRKAAEQKKAQIQEKKVQEAKREARPSSLADMVAAIRKQQKSS